jgi:putative membrane protein insertion efficiency factor
MRQILKQPALALLRAYKWAVSPMFLPACRYVPSCSEYAMEAIERYGVLRGGMKAAWRVLRCHPFAKGGVDPVMAKDFDRKEREGLALRAQRNRSGTLPNCGCESTALMSK